MDQNAAIAEHLRAGGTLTALEALHKFGCFRLSARIYDLQRAPYNLRIEKTTTELPNGKRVAKYRAILAPLAA